MSWGVRIEMPDGVPAPVVFDSPHSGSVYPDDFGHVIDRMLLRQSEDAHIDELFASAPSHGAPLLHALFPRCYIDPNRAESDIDESMIEDGWPGAEPGPKTLNRGVGLVWQRMRTAGAIYDRMLSRDEVKMRIEGFWRPYHDALRHLIDEAHARHGVCYHVDCHSMPSSGDAESEDGPVPRADFVLGDRDGTSCEGDFTQAVAAYLRDAGHEVKINDPYKGVELVRRYAEPAAGRHSLQLEINRRLFMDEATLTKTEGYVALERLMSGLCAEIVRYAEARAA